MLSVRVPYCLGFILRFESPTVSFVHHLCHIYYVLSYHYQLVLQIKRHVRLKKHPLLRNSGSIVQHCAVS